MARSRMQQIERTLGMATRFLDEVRGDIGRAALDGADIPPRLRSVHEKPGHATPEFRTLAIPVPDGLGSVPPEILSGTIAKYAQTRSPDCLMLAMEAEMDADGAGSRTVLIAEARDRTGTRMYWMQPYTPAGSRVDWDEPLTGGWCDPGEAEMILDAAFKRGEASYLRPDGAKATPEERARREVRRQTPMEDREVPLPSMAGRAD
ncbi:MAG: hypothetical protein KY467_05490 [Gemmatimonadetes bacterium]|nr:hypothetical protein [Gemmatimonadota bacterium]